MTSRSVMAPTWLEFAVLVLTILAVSGGLAAFEPHGQMVAQPYVEVKEIKEAGSAVKQMLLSSIYALDLLLLVRYARPWTFSFIGLPLLALLAWSFASVAWSVIPDSTLRRAVALSGPVLVGMYAGLRFDEERLTAVICAAAAVAVIGSVLWGLAPHTRAFDDNGHFRGLFYHKNAFGLFLGVSIISVIYRMAVLRDVGPGRILLLCGLLGCFVLAHSATPIVALSGALVTAVVTALLRRSEGLMHSIVPRFLCVAVIVVMMLGPHLASDVAEALGRDPTFSGRTTIWDFVLPMIGHRPWLGYGYGIFWLGEQAPGALFWYWSKQFELHAHDGYLQLLLDAGAVGLALFLASLALLVLRTIRLSRAGQVTLVSWIAVFLACFLVTNITDTELWQSNSIMTCLYVWAVVRVNRQSWLLSATEQAARATQNGSLTGQSPALHPAWRTGSSA